MLLLYTSILATLLAAALVCRTYIPEAPLELRQHVSSLGLQLGLTSPTYITNNPTTAQTKDTKIQRQTKKKMGKKHTKNRTNFLQIEEQRVRRRGKVLCTRCACATPRGRVRHRVTPEREGDRAGCLSCELSAHKFFSHL